jgi:hypothetical protein
MALTAADIKTRFPVFATTDNAKIDARLAEAGRQHNAAQWGGKSDDALGYFVAHLLAAMDGEGAGNGITATPGPGPLTGATEDRVSAAWSPLTVPKIFAQNDMGTTMYGRRYLSMVAALQTCRVT